MKLAILALLARSVISQFLLRASQCRLRTSFSDCNLVKACTWCNAVEVPSGCYRKSFAQSLSHGDNECGGMRKQRFEQPPILPSPEALPVPGPRGAPSQPPLVQTQPQPWRLGRRTLTALLGVVGLSLGNSQAALDTTSPRRTFDIKLVTFDDAEFTGRTWKDRDDGALGESYVAHSEGRSLFDGGTFIFDGKVRKFPWYRVPFLRVLRSAALGGPVAPGYYASETVYEGEPFPDVSSCEGISFIAMSTRAYKGYKFSFGDKKAEGGKKLALGYKAGFDPPLNEFGTVKIPFKDFTNFWDDETGDPIKTCQESPVNCPDKETLQDMGSVAFWGEGTSGKVHLEVKEINAYGCTDTVSKQELVTFNGNSGPIFLRLFAVASFGLVALIVVCNRMKSAPIATPLLG